jgi:hypothetical protein
MSAAPGAASGLAHWHQVVARRDPALLSSLLADDVVFLSPVVHTPQQGRDLTAMYLTGALHVLGAGFRYVREIADGDSAALEFVTEVDGLHVHGVDLIRFDEAGQIVSFTVMLRPLKGLVAVQQQMAALLASMQPAPTEPGEG